MPSLASHLFREVRPDLFRVLAGPLVRLYVDALDSLEREASQRNQGLDRSEALALVEQVVMQHGDLAEVDDNLIAPATTHRERARAVIEGASGVRSIHLTFETVSWNSKAGRGAENRWARAIRRIRKRNKAGGRVAGCPKKAGKLSAVDRSSDVRKVELPTPLLLPVLSSKSLPWRDASSRKPVHLASVKDC
jgi:hypothetical protein